MRFVIFFFFLSMPTIFAQKLVHPIDIKNKRCHENSIPTTFSAIKCENEALVSWNTEMNNYLKTLRKKTKQFNLELLERSQKKWLEFYKEDVALQYSYLDKLFKGGTMSRIVKMTYRKEATRKRALELKMFLDKLE